MQVKVLDALSCLQQESFKEGAIRIANNINVTDE